MAKKRKRRLGAGPGPTVPGSKRSGPDSHRSEAQETPPTPVGLASRAAGRLFRTLRSPWALAGILVLAGLLRLAHLIAIQQSPTAEHLQPEVRRKLSDAHRAEERPAEAGAAAPASSDAARARELWARSRSLRREARYQEAIATLREAIEVGPYDEGSRYELGNLMEAHAAPSEMVEYWSSARSQDPKPQTSLYFWAVGLQRQGDVSGALAKLAEALEVDPAHEISEERWGEILEEEGRLEEALEHFERATEIHPDFRMAHESCARVLDRLGRTEEAAARRRLAQEADPSSPRRYLHWGRYLVRVGRFRAAIPELEKALKAFPDNVEARDLLEQARAATSTR